ncbi:GIY-YIG nuclease family protein [Undibacterium seohonense]|uniref:GIY-YIG nuclease family protein n=1 Tax=Undibacterium seohonense TaxID=1344950 RepID=A0ABR6X246_9BURK|nr:GIY-YIG nuclease family protein [Undibacterium seohonense]MBC3807034.1 GIY-YIG nuclease family protein [Undibacterium seohonense]
MQPFSITLFATTGDPEGIRHLDKSNWSGFGVVFNKELFASLKHEPGFNQAGIYILFGDAAEETIYIGEADPVGDRLKTHVSKKEGWSWGVYFVDRNHKIGKTEVQYLESELINLAKKYDRAILMNKNIPNPPTMSPVAKATAQAFLNDMLLILPMLGINAFTPGQQNEQLDEVQPVSEESDVFDTIVVPARSDGFNKRFIEENCWFAIRIGAKYIRKIKYIAAYQVAPVGAITHYAEVDSIVPYGETGKFQLNFKGKAIAITPIPRTESSEINMQSPRYAVLEKIQRANCLDDVWK